MNTAHVNYTDKLQKLIDSVGFSPRNQSLALEYLTDLSLDDSLLSRAEPQDFNRLGWKEQGGSGTLAVGGPLIPGPRPVSPVHQAVLGHRPEHRDLFNRPEYALRPADLGPLRSHPPAGQARRGRHDGRKPLLGKRPGL